MCVHNHVFLTDFLIQYFNGITSKIFISVNFNLIEIDFFFHQYFFYILVSRSYFLLVTSPKCQWITTVERQSDFSVSLSHSNCYKKHTIT